MNNPKPKTALQKRADALRKNLLKRKQQTRARDGAASSDKKR
jgi:hypothetical protein